MADIWLPTFPQRFQREGYSRTVGDGRLISRMDAGPAKVRLRSSAMPESMQGRMEFDGSQLADLKSFFYTTLMGGSLPFEFPDQEPYNGVTMLLVRFAGGVPGWTNIAGDYWLVSLDLEVLP